MPRKFLSYWGKSYCLFYLFFSTQWAVLWHEAITSVWAFKRRKQGRAVSLDLPPYRQGCAGLAALLLPIPLSCPLLYSCWTPHSGWGDGKSPFIPLSPPHSLIILDPHFPKWVFWPYVKTQIISLLC